MPDLMTGFRVVVARFHEHRKPEKANDLSYMVYGGVGFVHFHSGVTYAFAVYVCTKS